MRLYGVSLWMRPEAEKPLSAVQQPTAAFHQNAALMEKVAPIPPPMR